MLSTILKELLNERHMTLQELADAAGIPMETMRNIYYNKVRDPKVSTMIAISKTLNVSVNYLMSEEIFNEEETAIIKNYRKCGIHGKSIIELVAKYESNISKTERDTLEKHKVPCLIPIGNVYDGIVYNSCEVVDVYTVLPEAYLAVEITTNFFAPTYCKGDRILLENRFPANGEHAVFAKDNRAYCRKYVETDGKYVLECLNGRGEDMVLQRMNEVECIGTCIGLIRE